METVQYAVVRGARAKWSFFGAQCRQDETRCRDLLVRKLRCRSRSKGLNSDLYKQGLHSPVKWGEDILAARVGPILEC